MPPEAPIAPTWYFAERHAIAAGRSARGGGKSMATGGPPLSPLARPVGDGSPRTAAAACCVRRKIADTRGLFPFVAYPDKAAIIAKQTG